MEVVSQQQKPPVVQVFSLFLQKHQQEILAVVDQKKRSSEDEDDEGVQQAMRWSLNEGWSLLLNLLDKRMAVLRLAADFYRSLVEVWRLVNINILGILVVFYFYYCAG